MCFTTKYKLIIFFLQIALYYIESLRETMLYLLLSTVSRFSWLPPTTIIGIRNILRHAPKTSKDDHGGPFILSVQEITLYTASLRETVLYTLNPTVSR